MPARTARAGPALPCDKIDWSALLLGIRTDADGRPGGGHGESVMTDKSTRKIGKILAVVAICAAVAAGGIGVATAPGWANPAPHSEASSPVRNEPGLATPVVKAVELGVTPLDGAKGVNPAVAPSVKAVNGRVQDVVLVPAAGGEAIKGTVSADGSTWTAVDPLAFNTPYNYSSTIVDGAGRETKKVQTFT